MPTFQWKGKNRYGDVVGGVRVARSVEDLSRTLQREQIQVMDISSPKAKGQAERFGHL
jgi:type II secretory pathway component PulF